MILRVSLMFPPLHQIPGLILQILYTRNFTIFLTLDSANLQTPYDAIIGQLLQKGSILG